MLFFTAAVILATGFSACKDNNEPDNSGELTEKEKALTPIVKQYVNHTVIATYKSLADESIKLADALVKLKENKTNAHVEAATKYWKTARDYWEKSEAFLYGAANDFSIDPHIDTWPLALDELKTELKNKAHIESMSKEDGDEWVANYLGIGLLGFHAIEYILFEDGKAKDISKISEEELIYVVAVAGDVRNQCFRLEASWAGIDNVTAEKKAKIEALEMTTTLGGGSLSYGDDMLQAGKPGSTRVNVTAAAVDILEGCIDIVDEVGKLKIGKPHTGEDINYIESPYSHNSIVDFVGNILSVQNAYLGGADANKRGDSLSDYFKKNNPSLDNKIKASIDNTIKRIEAIGEPFTVTFKSKDAGEAIKACDELLGLIEEAKVELMK